MNLLALLKENPLVIATAVVVLGALGASMNVTLPADEKIAELEMQVAQQWERRKEWEQKQDRYHRSQELQDIEYRMKYLEGEINRINQIPTYLDRDLTEQEVWSMEQRKQEWSLLKERHQQLMESLE